MNELLEAALTFVGAEFVPTLLALLAAAAREPMTWGVVAVAVVAHRAWRRLDNAPRP
jgi:hypothetical protein